VSDELQTYANDRTLARNRGHFFSVASKDGRGMPWQEVSRDIDDLDEAIRLARALEVYEAGVFAHGRFLYWTSAHPDLFNSTVLALSLE
jgi:hypothetical protein